MESLHLIKPTKNARLQNHSGFTVRLFEVAERWFLLVSESKIYLLKQRSVDGVLIRKIQVRSASFAASRSKSWNSGST